ncbi:cytochrome p450 [Moniliophthora roreri MCA 2997]|uniref:Cytochrome p450 n=1 Tax=Moniliophthora roreri (strain MCA 2997) TaxID=1381753 RepID=V2XPU6_MONRO|nr:cytochrome p450 [Moniliophthora roreri MCA 2997]
MYNLSYLIPTLLALFFICYRRSTQQTSRYPSGPKPLPLIGNLLDLPSTKTWKVFSDWGSLYGQDLLHFEVFGQHTLVVNSRKLAHELFEKRSRIHSDRPYIAMIDLLGWRSVGFGVMPYGETWRRHRRLFQEGLRDSAIADYIPVQLEKTQEFLVNLLKDPDNFRVHIRTLAAAVIIGVMYGHDVTSTEDYYVQLAERAFGPLSTLGTPSAMLVNLFPVMRYLPAWFPGGGFQHLIRQSHGWINDMVEKPYSLVVDRINSGIEKPSLLAKYLDRYRSSGTDDLAQEKAIKQVSAMAYGAGAETTVAQLLWFFLAMAMYPEIQKKAQEEIDNVVGKDRLPTHEDRANLPYIEALLRETMRWRPVTPLAFHAALEDDIIDGYFIPKGTALTGNIWAMSRDKAVYPDPEAFIPERFITEEGVCNDDDVNFIFGFGRRICPGRYLAIATVWRAMVSILSTFDITKAKDENGNGVGPEVEIIDGIVVNPGTFPCTITPRSDKARNLVTQLAC